ncbi:MAG: inositol monophosphatase family protein [Planctomyces sp.]|jgi:myo-inositol-1(or 4)-monophosphatase
MPKPIETALKAAREGGEIISRYFRDGAVMRSKGSSADLVSDADVNSERRIVQVIRETFPDHCVLGEEEHTEDIHAEHLWVIDPLDGTTNFAHQLPHFAVSIGYYHQGKAQCGVVWNPVRDDLYVAERGQGATHNGRRLRVGKQTSLSEVLIGIGFYYDRGAMMEATLAAVGDCFRQQIHGVRRFGTASLDLAQVASGSYGAYFEYQLSPWDFAAGQLILEESGGRVTTCAGDPMPMTKTSILASNGYLHDAMLEIVRKHLSAAFPKS